MSCANMCNVNLFCANRVFQHFFYESNIDVVVDLTPTSGPLGGPRSGCRPRAASAAGHAAFDLRNGQQRRTPGGSSELKERLRLR